MIIGYLFDMFRKIFLKRNSVSHHSVVITKKTNIEVIRFGHSIFQLFEDMPTASMDRLLSICSDLRKAIGFKVGASALISNYVDSYRISANYGDVPAAARERH